MGHDDDVDAASHGKARFHTIPRRKTHRIQNRTTIAAPNLSTSSGVFHHNLVRVKKEMGSGGLPI